MLYGDGDAQLVHQGLDLTDGRFALALGLIEGLLQFGDLGLDAGDVRFCHVCFIKRFRYPIDNNRYRTQFLNI